MKNLLNSVNLLRLNMFSLSKYFGFFLLLLFLSCSKDNKNEANLRLLAARDHFNNGDYTLAIQEIDSLNKLYPEAIAERKVARTLLDSARRGENNEIVRICDSLINDFHPKLEREKMKFVYQINKKYQDEGTYLPKELSSDLIHSTGLRAGVSEAGEFYIESVFVGDQRHNRLKVSSKDGSSAETLPVNDDGLNYHFSNLGKKYEIIRFSELNENRVGEFVDSHSDKSLKVTLSGSGSTSYPLSQISKTAIIKSYQLSILIQRIDSLKIEKEKAQFKLYNLDNK